MSTKKELKEKILQDPGISKQVLPTSPITQTSRTTRNMGSKSMLQPVMLLPWKFSSSYARCKARCNLQALLLDHLQPLVLRRLGKPLTMPLGQGGPLTSTVGLMEVVPISQKIAPTRPKVIRIVPLLPTAWVVPMLTALQCRGPDGLRRLRVV